MKGKRVAGVSSSDRFPRQRSNPQRKQSTAGASSIEETPIQAISPTPLPSGYPTPGTRLPSPPSSNESEQGEMHEDKVGKACSCHRSLNLNAFQEEFQLLDNGTPGVTESSKHEVKTAPLFTRDAKLPAGFCPHKSQYGLLGSLMGIK